LEQLPRFNEELNLGAKNTKKIWRRRQRVMSSLKDKARSKKVDSTGQLEPRLTQAKDG
jgi:hypothetical protein